MKEFLARLRPAVSRPPAAPYRSEQWTDEGWHESYTRGQFDYLAGLDELPRYSVLVGYIGFFGGSPRILDVGCGVGLLRTRLQGTDFSEYVGIDPTAVAIDSAKILEDERTRFILGDALDRSHALSAFDVVVCNEVLSVVPDPEALLARLGEVVSPGGLVLTSNWHHPGDEGLWALIDRYFEPVDRVEILNPANPVAVNGVRVACHRSGARAPGA